jgi:hypothetical protein
VVVILVMMVMDHHDFVMMLVLVVVVHHHKPMMFVAVVMMMTKFDNTVMIAIPVVVSIADADGDAFFRNHHGLVVIRKCRPGQRGRAQDRKGTRDEDQFLHVTFLSVAPPSNGNVFLVARPETPKWLCLFLCIRKRTIGRIEFCRNEQMFRQLEIQKILAISLGESGA